MRQYLPIKPTLTTLFLWKIFFLSWNCKPCKTCSGAPPAKEEERRRNLTCCLIPSSLIVPFQCFVSRSIATPFLAG